MKCFQFDFGHATGVNCSTGDVYSSMAPDPNLRFAEAGVLAKYGFQMKTYNSTLSDESNTGISLLWIPHFLIAVGFLTFLAINFWCYHKKYQERFQRKNEALQMKARLRERRRALNIVKLRYMVDSLTDEPSPGCNGSCQNSKGSNIPIDFGKHQSRSYNDFAKAERDMTNATDGVHVSFQANSL